MKRLWLVLLLCLTASVAFGQANPSPAQADQNAQTIKSYLFNTPFSKLDDLVVGDPVKWVISANAPLARAKIGQSIARFCIVLCIAGLLVSLWRARAVGSTPGYVSAFLRFVVGVILISVSLNDNGNKKDWNISVFMFSAWTNGYGWAVDRFGSDVDAAMIEAQDALGDTLGQVTIAAVTLTGAQIGVQATKAAVAAAVAGKAEGALGRTAAKVATTAISGSYRALLSKMRWVLGAFMPLMQAYAGTIFASGVVMLLGLYLMPFAFALMVWGQGRLIFVSLMLLLTSILTVTLIPWIFAVGVKLAFVQPAQTIRYYNDQLAVKRTEAQHRTAQIEDHVRAAGRTLSDDCKAAIAADPTGKAEEEDPACRALRGGTWLENMTSGLVNILTQNLSIISDAINGIINAVNTLFIAMIAIFIGMALAVVLVLSLPIMIGNFLGASWPGRAL